MPKKPEPCKSADDCIETETCYMGICEDPCQMEGVCASTAICQAKMHRPICNCPKGLEGNPAIKCTTPKSRKTNIIKSINSRLRTNFNMIN